MKDEYTTRIRVRTLEITPLSTFTGVTITRNRQRGTLTISQAAYIDQLAQRHKGQFVKRKKPAPTSAASRHEFDKMQPGFTGEQVDKILYLKLMGSLIWPASMTRPDVAYYVSFLASYLPSYIMMPRLISLATWWRRANLELPMEVL